MRHVFIYIIRIYQKFSRYTPRVCRYEPTCSEYAAQAIAKYGPVKGIGMAAWRLLRCNPWSPGGIDPVK
ncbi:MAG: membrane protein insertion efficiency factor YidD [Armatimonadota bacterium]